MNLQFPFIFYVLEIQHTKCSATINNQKRPWLEKTTQPRITKIKTVTCCTAPSNHFHVQTTYKRNFLQRPHSICWMQPSSWKTKVYDISNTATWLTRYHILLFLIMMYLLYVSKNECFSLYTAIYSDFKENLAFLI